MLSNPYLYLSLIGLSAKIWAAHRLHQSSGVRGAKLCLLFLFLAYSMTTMEVYSYYCISIGLDNFDIALALKVYYILIYGFLLTLPVLFNQITHTLNSPRFITAQILTFCSISYATLFTDIIVADASMLTYSVTRVKGVHYWLFILFIIYNLSATLHSLSNCYKNMETTELIRLKSANLMIGFIPVFFTLLATITLMELGILINATGILTLTLALLIFVMAENLRTDRILDLRVYVPWSAKAKMIRQLTKPFREVTLQPETAKGLSTEYDKSLVLTAKQMFPTQKDAAAWLGITESKMSRMLKK